MTALTAILMHLLLGFAPIHFHQETQPDGWVIQCTPVHACVPLEGNTSTPHVLPSEEVLP